MSNPNYDPRSRFARGSYITRWMHKLKLTYEDVGTALGVHPITVRNWVKARSLRPMVKLAFDQVYRPTRVLRTARTYRRPTAGIAALEMNRRKFALRVNIRERDAL